MYFLCYGKAESSKIHKCLPDQKGKLWLLNPKISMCYLLTLRTRMKAIPTPVPTSKKKILVAKHKLGFDNKWTEARQWLLWKKMKQKLKWIPQVIYCKPCQNIKCYKALWSPDLIMFAKWHPHFILTKVFFIFRLKEYEAWIWFLVFTHWNDKDLFTVIYWLRWRGVVSYYKEIISA